MAVQRWGPGAQAPNLAVLLAHCGQLILSKISKYDATRYQFLMLMHKIRSISAGAAPPDPAEGAYSATETP